MASPVARCSARSPTTTSPGSTTSRGRFSSPVLPGDALTVRAWRTGAGEAVFTTSVGDRVVIDQGLVRFS